jgi:hypothetical protein
VPAELQSIITTIASVVIGFFGFWKYIQSTTSNLHNRINHAKDKLSNDISILNDKHENERVHVAENYVKKEEIRNLERKMENMEERILRAIKREV